MQYANWRIWSDEINKPWLISKLCHCTRYLRYYITVVSSTNPSNQAFPAIVYVNASSRLFSCSTKPHLLHNPKPNERHGPQINISEEVSEFNYTNRRSRNLPGGEILLTTVFDGSVRDKRLTFPQGQQVNQQHS